MSWGGLPLMDALAGAHDIEICPVTAAADHPYAHWILRVAADRRRILPGRNGPIALMAIV